MSKVIISLKGRETKYLTSEAADLASDLRRIIKSFISENDDAKMALRDSEYADKKLLDLVQDVCMYFEEEDFIAYPIELIGFKLNLRKPCKRIQSDLTRLGQAAGAKIIQHRAVAVGGYVVDLCHTRIGSNYPADTLMQFDELKTYWSRVKDETTSRIASPRAARNMTQAPVAVAPARIQINLTPDTDQHINLWRTNVKTI